MSQANGDPRRFIPLDDEKKQLVEANILWAYKVANEVSRRHKIDMETAVSGAFEGMIRAAQTWDSEKSSFTNYSRMHMVQRIFLSHRHDMRLLMMMPSTAAVDERRRPNVGSLVSDTEPSEWLADRKARTPDDVMENAEIPDRIEAALAVLPERHRRVFRMRLFEEMTLQEISDDLGISPERVRQIYLSAIGSVRDSMRGKNR